MSLTRHLKNADSPVRNFIYASAPALAAAGIRGPIGTATAKKFGFDKLTSLVTQIPIPAEVKRAQRKSHAVVAGMALDYRLRMDLPGFDVGETTAWRGLERLQANSDAIHRGKHIAQLLQDALNFGYLTLKEKDPHPLSLARISIPLAWCEAIYRAGPVSALTNDLGRRIKRAEDAVGLMMSIDEELIFDVAQMHKPLVPLLQEWDEAEADGRVYTPNPTFLGSNAVGGADADLVIDDLLVEVKTREQITNPWIRDTLFQLLGYALLDIDDLHGIRRVAILLPRQPYIAIWDLDDLLGRDADDALPELREEFAALLMGMMSNQPREGGADDEFDDDELVAELD
ncbi:hypothetical protein [Microterricola viridarii]|uniref:Uncharacterized protein n=1 Tax=Microterricola viridarii TaxID=412690 RepID=A0A1H1V9K9_9MICO|nr:hypothetical protein [Microterricola viridarii]SDS81086.1 hypothetical protein SAMN04489834_2201 [Microterricola viridarii]